MYHIRESIRPSADLRNHYNEISKQCWEENEAVIKASLDELFSGTVLNCSLFFGFSGTEFVRITMW